MDFVASLVVQDFVHPQWERELTNHSFGLEPIELQL